MKKILLSATMLLLVSNAYGGDLQALSVRRLVNFAFSEADYRPTNVQVTESEAIDSLVTRGADAIGLGDLSEQRCRPRIRYKEVHFNYRGSVHNCMVNYQIYEGYGFTTYYAYIMLNRCTTELSREMAEEMDRFYVISGDLESVSTDSREYNRGVNRWQELCELYSDDK